MSATIALLVSKYSGLLACCILLRPDDSPINLFVSMKQTKEYSFLDLREVAVLSQVQLQGVQGAP